MANPLTAEDLAAVERHYRSLTHAEIGDMIGRSKNCVRNLCSRMGWTTRDDKWTDAEIAKLIEWYTRPNGHGRDTLHLQTLAAELGRGKANVCRKAKVLGLTKQGRPAVTDDYREKISACTKKRIGEKGHPRGALGHKHSPETRKVIGEKARKSWAKRRKQPILLQLRAVQTARTNVVRYGTASPVHSFNKGQNVYSRCRRGVREDLGFFVRSRWEANYARYLVWMKNNGQIADFKYEPETFRFDGVTRGPYTYKPDFLVIEKNGNRVFHEVKGWMDPGSRSRLKRFAKFYPGVSLVVIDAKAYREIQRKVSSVIPGWESEKE